MIQDLQRSTMAAAHRWEGQRIYCTTNALAYKKNTVESGLYCLLGRHRLISSTATVLSWPTTSLQSTDHCAVARHPQTRVLSFETPQLLLPLCLHCGMPGSMPTHTPIYSSGGQLHVAWPWLIATAAAAFTFMRRIPKLPTVLGHRAVSL